MAVAGASVALIPTISRPILRTSLSAFDNVAVGAFYGSLVGTILLFAMPVTLLGCVSPFAVRLRLERVESAHGNTAGNLYALSTIGSITGSFLPTFLLVPVFGTRTTFLILAAALVVPASLALLLLQSARRIAALALAAVVALVPILFSGGGLIRPAEYGRVIYKTETPYNYVQVLDRDGQISTGAQRGPRHPLNLRPAARC